MDERKYSAKMKKAIQGKFHGRASIQSKVTPRYSPSAEREMLRLINSYMRIVKASVKKSIPSMISLYKDALKERKKEAHFDGVFEYTYAVNSETNKLTYDIERRITEFGIERFISIVGETAKRASVYDWKRIVKQTLGEEIFSDYYDDDFFAELLRKWVTDRISETHSLSEKISKGIKAVLFAGLTAELTSGELIRSVDKYLNSQTRSLRYWGSDSVVSLSANCNKLIYQDAGIKRYRWSDSGDGRVRISHRAFNGNVYRYDNPPEGYYVLKDGTIKMTGRRCNPGEDYGCRCVAIPIFDYEGVEIPFAAKEESYGGS